MRIEITKNTFEPAKKTPTIFKQGEVVELPDESAQILIKKGHAIPAEAEEAPKEPKHKAKEPKKE